MMFHMKNLAIVGIIINKNKKKYWDPPILETEEGPQTSEWIRSKISVDIDSLVLKEKTDCFPNWHETQSKFSMDTEPNKPLKAKWCTREEDVWPSRACQSAREGIEETEVATKIGTTGGRQRLSMGNIHPTLGPVLSSYPVLESYTIHPK